MSYQCNICNRRVARHAHFITCFNCKGRSHINCLPLVSINDSIYINRDNNPWLCTICVGDNLPFCGLQDDDEFNNALLELRSENDINLNDTIFNVLDFEDLDDDFLTMCDPDINFYNDFRNNLCSSEYYSIESFKHKIKQQNISRDCFSIVHANVRSVHKNISKVVEFNDCAEFPFSIIALSETWLTDVNCNLYNINGYNAEHTVRKVKRGGGVSLYIKDKVSYSKIDELSLSNDILESVFISINKCEFQSEKDIIVGVIYRPPNTNVSLFNELMESLLSKIDMNKHKLYLAGDYNINLLNSDSHASTSDFIDLMYTSSLFPLICKPTRVQNRSATIIDNIFSNISINERHMNGIFINDLSDHFPIFHIDYTTLLTNKTTVLSKRCFSDSNVIKFVDMLSDIDWTYVLECSDAQTSFSLFHIKLCESFNMCFPIENIKLNYKNKKHWLTKNLKHCISVKNKLYVRFKKHPNLVNEQKYKTYRNKLNCIIRKEERKHYESLFEKYKHDLKRKWSILKEVINSKKKVSYPKQFKLNKTLCDNKQDIANAFNQYFVNIGANLANAIPASQLTPTSYLNQNLSESFFVSPKSEFEIS